MAWGIKFRDSGIEGLRDYWRAGVCGGVGIWEWEGHGAWGRRNDE